MSSIEDRDPRQRRRLTSAIRESMRAMSVQLSLLSHHVGAHLDLRDVDLNCLDMIVREGPFSPSALSRRAGLHPATVTGILDRLERGGWVARERDPADRRAVLIRALRERGPEVVRLYSGMTTALDEICAGFDAAELDVIATFLRRATDAGKTATGDLAGP